MLEIPLPFLPAGVGALARGFRRVPTAYVVDGYGGEGNAAVWPYRAEALLGGEQSLTLSEQERLWHSYRRACIRLGLDVIPTGSVPNYRVAEFLHQAWRATPLSPPT